MIFPSEQGQYFEIWDKVSIEKLQMNTMQWSWSVHKEHVLLWWSYVFLFSAGQLINSNQNAVPGGGAGNLGRSTRYWALVMSYEINEHWWNQRSLWQ